MSSGDYNMEGVESAAMGSTGTKEVILALKAPVESTYDSVYQSLSPVVRKRVNVLREIQRQHDRVKARFLEERRALEDKYLEMYQPFYTKRFEIVNGVVEVEGVTHELAIDQVMGKDDEEKGVPNFWLIAMKTNEEVSDSIHDRDDDALKYLKDIKWSRLDGRKGFKLEFSFDPNPYFKNSILTKTYCMADEDEPLMEKAIGTEIEWYPGKCLTGKTLMEQPRAENVQSFFNFFSPPAVPDSLEGFDAKATDELQGQFEIDYDLGATIRDKIIPHAVSWFTGEAILADDFDDSDDDDDIDDEDIDFDDLDEDEFAIDEDKDVGETDPMKSDEAQEVERPPECKPQ